MLTLYCYPKCATCQKAKKWLDDRNLAYALIDIKSEHPDEKTIAAIHRKSGLHLRRFFNTSGMLYRELHLTERLPDMSEMEQLALLGSDGMLIKRPLLIGDDFVLVGFREKDWAEKLNR